MAKRKLLKDQDRRKLFDIPVDEDSFIVRLRRGPPFQFDVNVADCPYGRE